MEKIFKQSIDLFGEELIRMELREVMFDTCVQEQNSPCRLTVKLYEKPFNTAKGLLKRKHQAQKNIHL